MTDRPRILFTGLDPANFRVLGDLLHWPALEIVPDDEGTRQIPWIHGRLRRRGFAWIVFTSKLAVTSFFTALAQCGGDARVFAGVRIVAANSGAAQRLREHFVQADVVADADGNGGWTEQMAGATVLAVHGSRVPGELDRRLEESGANVTHLTLHRAVPHPELGRPLPTHDVIYFVSPSGVEAYGSTYGLSAFRQEVWCLGEATRAAAERFGIVAKVVNPLSKPEGVLLEEHAYVFGDD